MHNPHTILCCFCWEHFNCWITFSLTEKSARDLDTQCPQNIYHQTAPVVANGSIHCSRMGRPNVRTVNERCGASSVASDLATTLARKPFSPRLFVASRKSVTNSISPRKTEKTFRFLLSATLFPSPKLFQFASFASRSTVWTREKNCPTCQNLLCV
jgi:hypothetical protein